VDTGSVAVAESICNAGLRYRYDYAVTSGQHVAAASAPAAVRKLVAAALPVSYHPHPLEP